MSGPFAVLNKATFHRRIGGPTPLTAMPSVFQLRHTCVSHNIADHFPRPLTNKHTHTHTPSLRQTRISFFLSGGVTVPMTDRARLIKGYIALLFHSQVLRSLNAVSGVITDLGKSINCINRVWRTITAKDKIFLFYFLFVQHVGVSL